MPVAVAARFALAAQAALAVLVEVETAPPQRMVLAATEPPT
jgi:hypothetical protein